MKPEDWVPSVLLRFRCHGVCPHQSCFLSVVRGVRNGAYYGAKIRFPHALVMTFLFRSGPLRDKLRFVLTATYEHAKNLATFVGLFKLALCLLRHLLKTNAWPVHWAAGALGGCLVFGTETNVNSQINMYVLSRIVVAGGRILADKSPVEVPSWSYSAFAAIVWGCVMAMFEETPDHLQSSLVSSMDFLYKDSDRWPTRVNSFLQWFSEAAPDKPK